MIDIKELLNELCEDDAVFDDDTDLIESGIMDSYVFIELLTRLEDEGISIQPTRVDRSAFRTVKGIEALVKNYKE